MSETEFWKRCFQSSFFYRDRKVKGKQDSIFDKAAKEEEEEAMNVSTNFNAIHTFLLDLTEAELMDEYPTELDSTMRLSKTSQSIPLIRRYNRHGEIVIGTLGSDGTNDGNQQKDCEKPRHKQILREMMNLPDLMPQRLPEPVKLNLKRETDYFKPLADEEMEVSVEDRVKAVKEVYDVIKGKQLGIIEPDSLQCLAALNRLSTNYSSADAKKAMIASVPPETMQDLMTLNMNGMEILRHFWSSVPPTKSEEAANKFARMDKLLQSLSDRLDGFQESGKELAILSSLVTALEKARKIREQYMQQ